MNYLIGLDIGTSSVKGVLVREDGKEKLTATESFLYRSGADGSVEIDAEQYIAVCFALLRRLSVALPADGKLCGICAASAGGNLLLLDADGQPCTPIFNWQDRRVTDEASSLLAGLDTQGYYETTGWPFDFQTFPLAMLCWLKCHFPQTLAQCGKVCMSTEYFYYRLTGKWGISTSAGTPFYLIDQRRGAYAEPMLKRLGIAKDKLPPIGNTGDILGNVTAASAERCGIPAGTPVMLGTFDHPSAARGAGILEEGQMLLSCGTSWVGFYPVSSRDKAIANHMLTDPFLSPEGCWAGMVSLPSVSGGIKRYIQRYITDGENLFEAFAEAAAQSETGAGGLLLNPMQEPDDSLVKGYSKAHIARAVMEGTVRLLREQLTQIQQSGICVKSAVMTGGPSGTPLWIEVIEEMLGIEVRVVHAAYAGAIGAAGVAGIGAGIYKDEATAYEALQ